MTVPIRRFRSKVDAWLVVTLLLSAVVTLWAAWNVGSRATVIGQVAATVLVALGAGLPLWILAATHYTVTADELRVRCGPFRWVVPLSAIIRIEPTRVALSGPALSLDRLRIDQGPGKSMLVSPPDQAAFIRAVKNGDTDATRRPS